MLEIDFGGQAAASWGSVPSSQYLAQTANLTGLGFSGKTWQEVFATLERIDLSTLTDAYDDEDAQFEAEFNRLKESWRKERNPLSSFVEDSAMCLSYQQIIGLGPTVIPLILRELQREGNEPDHWFWALAALARHGPDIAPESRGNLREMANAWLQWGMRRGYIRGQGLGIKVSLSQT